MNLGHSHQTTIGLTFDHLNHCWHCGVGCALHCLSPTWQLYRCESPSGHFWIRCPVHRTWAAVDQVGRIDLTRARCLCHVDDADGPFVALTRWTLDVDRLMHLDTLVLPRCVIDLMNRGNLVIKDDDRVLYYKTRTATPTVDRSNDISAAMQQVRGWYNLNLHALTKLLLHWKPDLTDTALHALLSGIEMVNRQRPKRHWTEDGAAPDLDARTVKRARLDHGAKRGRDDTEPSERSVKRRRVFLGMDGRARNQGTKRRQIERVMDERVNKRARLPTEEPKKKKPVSMLGMVRERPVGTFLLAPGRYTLGTHSGKENRYSKEPESNDGRNDTSKNNPAKCNGRKGRRIGRVAVAYIECVTARLRPPTGPFAKAGRALDGAQVHCSDDVNQERRAHEKQSGHEGQQGNDSAAPVRKRLKRTA